MSDAQRLQDHLQQAIAAIELLASEQQQLLAAGEELARYADECELILRETHPGKAQVLGARVAAWIALSERVRSSKP